MSQGRHPSLWLEEKPPVPRGHVFLSTGFPTARRVDRADGPPPGLTQGRTWQHSHAACPPGTSRDREALPTASEDSGTRDGQAWAVTPSEGRVCGQCAPVRERVLWEARPGTPTRRLLRGHSCRVLPGASAIIPTIARIRGEPGM